MDNFPFNPPKVRSLRMSILSSKETKSKNDLIAEEKASFSFKYFWGIFCESNLQIETASHSHDEQNQPKKATFLVFSSILWSDVTFSFDGNDKSVTLGCRKWCVSWQIKGEQKRTKEGYFWCGIWRIFTILLSQRSTVLKNVPTIVLDSDACSIFRSMQRLCVESQLKLIDFSPSAIKPKLELLSDWPHLHDW